MLLKYHYQDFSQLSLYSSLAISYYQQQYTNQNMSCIPPPSASPEQRFRFSSVQDKANKQILRQEKNKKIALAEQGLISLYNIISNTKDMAELSSSIKEYCIIIVSNNSEQLFVKYFYHKSSYFAQYKFMQLLNKKMKQYKNSSQFLKSVFSLFQFLMKALKRDEELVYFLLKINQEGFITSTYYFQEEQDIAYYANFLKLMVRKINEHEKYLTVFFNCREPHFPLLLKLLKFYDCPDVVMHTSSKLAIMQISNNQNALVQKYTNNFPFILFYPLYVGQILESLKKAINQQDNGLHLQNLQNHLKYMQDFISNKNRQAVDIYTNTFLKMIGVYLYGELAVLTDKNIKKIKKIYKILVKYIIPQLSVVKIKTCLLLMFNTSISTKMSKCFTSKPVSLQTQYWLIDECLDEITLHCKKIHYKDEHPSKSFFKTINSYIPRSKDNWLYYQMRKISDIIGFKVVLDEEINHDSYNQDSFLSALWTMIDDTFKPNDIYLSLKKIKDEELLYYNFKILRQLVHCYNNQIKINMDLVVQEMSTCNSLSLIKIFYLFVVQSKVHFEESEFIQKVYENIGEKLNYFIMTKGMKEFMIRVKTIQIQNNPSDFFLDIYREIECQMLLYVALRTLLGFPNNQGSKFQMENWQNQKNVTAQTTIRCRALNATGTELSVILDGQHMKIKNRSQHLIHKQELLIHNIKFYEQADTILLCGNQNINNYSTTIYVDPQIRPYFLKQISYRKQLSTKIMLILRQMQFELTQK